MSLDRSLEDIAEHSAAISRSRAGILGVDR
jgi:hypothetical protein